MNNTFWEAVMAIVIISAIAAIFAGLTYFIINIDSDIVDKCTKICNLKGYEYWDYLDYDCKCLNKFGDILKFPFK